MSDDHVLQDNYLIVYGRSTELIVAMASLEQGVNRRIAIGWWPTGGISIIHEEIQALIHPEFICAQAMLRKQND